MFKFFTDILDFIYKKKCYFCGRSYENALMCSNCYDKIESLTLSPMREIFGIKVYCSCFYTKEMQKLIRGVKYHNQRELAKFQAKFMYEYFKPVADKDYVIVPVPLHKKRFKQRKYNHMELVANELSLLSGWVVQTNLIERVKETKPQYKLHTKEREENLKNAFKVNKANYNGQELLVIDDILTTGSTLKEIILEFQKNDICKITCFTTTTVYGGSVNTL